MVLRIFRCIYEVTFVFNPDLRCSISTHDHIVIHMTLTGCCIGCQSRGQVRVDVLNYSSLVFGLIVSFATRTPLSFRALFKQALQCLNPMPISGALTWSCAGQSAAPCLAASATVSCDVWAEAGVLEVQEVPVLQCSPASSPALRGARKIKEKGKS